MSRQSIRTRVMLALMLMTLVPLGLATLLSMVMDLTLMRDHMLRDLQVLAQVVGENCVSALVFDDPETARRQLATLEREYQIREALLYDAAGREVARWQREAADLDDPRTAGLRRLLATRVRVDYRMRFDDRPVGHILIHARLDELNRQLAQYLWIAGLFALLTLAAALALALRLQRRLSDPILALAEQSRVISVDETFAARIRDPGAGPELATLVQGFNAVLDAVEHRESELAQRADALDLANRRLRRLAIEMALVEETERARLAGELHDSPMQKLALAQMQVDAAGRERDAESEQMLATGLQLLREGISELRSLQFELSPPVLHQRGLPAALEWLAANARVRWGLPIHCVIGADTPPLGHDLSVILFRAARELVYNLIKHARATRGEIRLTGTAAGLELRVEDDGIGFDTDGDGAPGSPAAGFGLYSLRERVALLGGSLSVEALAPGTRVSIRLPVTVLGEFPKGRRPPAPHSDQGDARP